MGSIQVSWDDETRTVQRVQMLPGCLQGAHGACETLYRQVELPRGTYRLRMCSCDCHPHPQDLVLRLKALDLVNDGHTCLLMVPYSRDPVESITQALLSLFIASKAEAVLLVHLLVRDKVVDDITEHHLDNMQAVTVTYGTRKCLRHRQTPTSYIALAGQLREACPGLGKITKCECGKTGSVFDTIIHLNDTHRWTRERIADWTDTLDIDLTVHFPERNDDGHYDDPVPV